MGCQSIPMGAGIAWIPELELESGAVIQQVQIRYETYGTLSPDRDNAILVCHALTGDAHAMGDGIQPGWWDGVIGPGKALDPTSHFIICSNVLGGCSGSTGPTSIQAETHAPYQGSFPNITIRDMVRAQKAMLEFLGVPRLAAVVGGSMGGMQVLEWLTLYPDFMEVGIPIATCTQFSAMGIAYNHVMRMAILNDPEYQGGFYPAERPPSKGLSLARAVGMITYRSFELYDTRFGRDQAGGQPDELIGRPQFQIESYLQYQGEKFVGRFDANSYLRLLAAMDSHDLGRGRGGVQNALRQIQADTFWIGIDTDLLYPAHEMEQTAQFLKENGKRSCYRTLKSIHGHDAFLLEVDIVNQWIDEFLVQFGIKQRGVNIQGGTA